MFVRGLARAPNLFSPSMQVPPFRQGAIAHSSRSTWHSLPPKPDGHQHRKPPDKLSQVAPLVHGSLRHSSSSIWHMVPVNPTRQWHKKVPYDSSTQVPPF